MPETGQRQTCKMAAEQETVFCMAPLRGITVRAYREVFADFYPVPQYAVAPFIPTVAGERIKPSLLKDVACPPPAGMRIVPQLIGRDPAQLAAMLGALKDLGYSEVNLNAGCPWKFVARKGRGAGLMEDADNLRRMLDAGCTALPGGFSIKVRLGMATTEILAQRIGLLNEYPLREVIIHPRTASQMYGGLVHLDVFESIYRSLRVPVVYNGDIYTVEDFMYLQKRFPDVKRWMIGRGLITDPCLPGVLRNLAESVAEPERSAAATVRKLVQFHNSLYERYRGELFGPTPVLGRMKELWGYLYERFADGDRLLRAVQRCQQLPQYEKIVADWFGRTEYLKAVRSRQIAALHN